MLYTFEWDPPKGKQNLKKHGVSFTDAAEVFLDPHAASFRDDPHSSHEERWITMGRTSDGVVVVIVHLFAVVSKEECLVRIISARKPTRSELRQYEEEHS